MSVQLVIGDCREVLKTLPDGSVHCCITSPPYFGLRDYGTAQWDGGDPACDHIARPLASPKTTLGIGKGVASHEAAKRYADSSGGITYRDTCRKCGAVRIDQQIGLESSLDAYLTTLVEVFREVRRVLRDDGTLWLNMGDSYATHAQAKKQKPRAERGNGTGVYKIPNQASFDAKWGRRPPPIPSGLKEKDLMMVPARLALALQADGWYLRSDCIWHKPNPMPESVTDRPTSSHEHIFLLTKRSTYFFDQEAVREKTGNEMSWEEYNARTAPGATWESGGITRYAGANKHDGGHAHPAGRNLRNVWTIATQPYAAAHFATFPPKLVEPCIKAGTSEKGCCVACGAPWVRQVGAATGGLIGKSWHDHEDDLGLGNVSRTGGNATKTYRPGETLGWQPSCQCQAREPIPCTVLDPFAGAGTTGLVADRLGRNSILIELNPAYVTLTESRITNDAPLFASVEVIA